jgi:hypothetical protein
VDKRIVSSIQSESKRLDQVWLDVERLAAVEITSEDPNHPIECALLPGYCSGWRAAEPGVQTIRLLFAEPRRVSRILLRFVETTTERTQEYVIRWASSQEQPFREIVRQQWNFSPRGSTSETEIHQVDLSALAVFELSIIPNIAHNNVLASLERLRLAS